MGRCYILLFVPPRPLFDIAVCRRWLRSHAALLEGGRAAAAAGSAVTVEQADCAGMDVNTDMAGIPAARQSDKEGGGLISTMVETSAEVRKQEAVPEREREHRRFCTVVLGG